MAISSPITYDYVILSSNVPSKNSTMLGDILPENIVRDLSDAKVKMCIVRTLGEVRAIKPAQITHFTQGIILPNFWKNGDALGILQELLLTYQFAGCPAAKLKEAMKRCQA